MNNVFFRKENWQALSRIKCVLQRLQCSNSSLVQATPTIKSLEKKTRSRIKKPFRKNFIENLFVNKIDPKILEYPEINTIQEVESLVKHSNIARDHLSITGREKDSIERISDEVVSVVKQLDLTALKLPIDNKGFGYLETEYCYMKEALSSTNLPVTKTVLENEDCGVQLLDKFGSESLKEKYLTKLTSGESLACLAHLESGPLVSLNPVSIDTKAVKTSDGENYIVSGKKNWVYNASYADVLIFSANVQDSEEVDKGKLTLFVIDKNSKGVTVHEPIQLVGLQGLNVCEVSFNEVAVPKDCVLGKVHEGNVIIKKVLSLGKLNNGAECITLMKKLINKSVKHCIDNKFFKKNKYDKLLYKVKIGNLVSRLYALESMTYLVTGRLDSFTDADVFLETLILKIFASECLHYALKESLAILGADFYSEDSTLDEILRDAQFFKACEDSNDHLKVVLSTAGLRYAKQYRTNEMPLFEKIKEFFGPHLTYAAVNRLESLNGFLMSYSEICRGYLHLAFETESVLLEDMVFKFSKVVVSLLNKYGDDVYNKHHQLKLLADLLVLIYATVANLGRASRAYCLAFRNQDIDYWSARSEVHHYHSKFHIMKKKLEYGTGSNDLEKLGSCTIENKYPKNFPILSKMAIVK